MRRTARREKLIVTTLTLIVAGCFAAMIALSLGGCAEESEDPIPQEHSDSDYVPADDTTGTASSALTESAAPSAAVGSTYDRGGAQRYTLDYAKFPNPAYAYCGSWILENGRPTYEKADCTDFASQVLSAGGLPMNPSHDETGWWYSGSCSWWGSSPSWRQVNSLIAYLISISHRGQTVGRARDLQIGDLIFYQLRREESQYACPQQETFNHTTVVSGFDAAGEPLVSYHSNDALNVPWRADNGSLGSLGHACRTLFVHIKD